MNTAQDQTPLFDALIKHERRKAASFHVPGHKSGKLFPGPAMNWYRQLLTLDVTELPGLDDLHAPDGAIREAERLLSDLYGSDESWLLIGGSTVGNLAMLRAACTRDDRVLIQRNAHQSILNGVKLLGLRPVFLAPRLDAESGLAVTPTPSALKGALERYPDVKAVVITNPNYYGLTADLRKLIAEAHRHGIPALVDEAHGAHFVAGDPFPASALSCGADAVVHSAHKTLPAMTMGAYLHVQGTRVSREKVKESLRMLQSSSPSYPILASLDLARAFAANFKNQNKDEFWEAIEKLRGQLREFPSFSLIEGTAKDKAYERIDPLKVTLQSRCRLSGFQLAERLREKAIDVELADPAHVLFVLPLSRTSDFDRLIAALNSVLKGIPPLETLTKAVVPELPWIAAPVPIEGRKTHVVPLQAAEGLIAAEEVTPYPPGVPVLVRGEPITASHIETIRNWHEAGGRFQAGADAMAAGIRVVDEE
ncbi:MAG TPA: aminotransferase class I/II-fold pyridoxal phosphate-dependent enzyme [Bacillales bacterium]|nr:aminotransferase class I/II-fold pyridoxal phosphate-dependent enzyme [Bacillales bacterium]